MTAMDSQDQPVRRQRNPRGEGYRLRDEIIAAASVILERTGSEDTVTLRGVAREVGIAVPSIEPHFVNRAAIIDAVVAKELAALVDAERAALDSTDEPVARLFAVARAYVGYAWAHPGGYRILTSRRFIDDWDAQGRVMEQTAPILTAGVELVANAVQACIDADASEGTDAYVDAVMLWFAVHGLISIPQAITSVPWPDLDELLVTFVSRVLRLKRPAIESLPKPTQHR